jgi:hypothetical protein
MKELCPVCHKEEAINDEYYGVLPCFACMERQAKSKRANRQAEFVGEDIKQQRKAYKEDILPAHRKGHLDKGFVEKYGTRKAKEQGFSEKEIKNAKYVWNDESYYKKGN